MIFERKTTRKVSEVIKKVLYRIISLIREARILLLKVVVQMQLNAFQIASLTFTILCMESRCVHLNLG